ncbi:hypothetical protein KUTeg_008348 [Tegillarca granosa]|uniref:Uncharacterized protein n=1 Tax=Tegillarca granosa TaxID=220873 RepID=A0ABQ9FBM1_TEGGR|nr:hypothetical protein KUTeg_008348 [Tegillarca granosa]
MRGRIIQDLANLKQLDEVDITKQEKLEAGFALSSDDEEEEEEEGGEGAGIHDKICDLRSQVSNILLRSQKRVEQNLLLHQMHESQLDDIREGSTLLSSSRNNRQNPK